MNNFRIFIFFCFLFYSTASRSIVKTLPGYSDNLPFKLETGYVNVGENDDIKLFYYFIEYERDPQEDPLILWLTGGPGCSGLCALAFGIGPIAFDASSFKGGLPSLILRPYSWTKIANVIFIDSPVGTGFSYATHLESYYSSDILSAKDTYTFLRKWLLNHPMFIKNHLFIAGDSYGGKIVPIVASEISKGNEEGLQPQMPLKGYLIGNPITDEKQCANERIPYAHGMALIPDEYYELAKSSCLEQYVDHNQRNVQCLHALELFRKDDVNYVLSYSWTNNPAVQDALHVKKGTIKEWKKCSDLDSYEHDVASTVPYHRFIAEKNYNALVYSGDHDLTAPYLATMKWIKHLNLTLDDGWRPWNVNGQVAGYTQRYKKNETYLTFATIKGAGHTAPEYKPEECYTMVDRWFSSFPL